MESIYYLQVPNAEQWIQPLENWINLRKTIHFKCINTIGKLTNICYRQSTRELLMRSYKRTYVMICISQSILVYQDLKNLFQ